MARCRTFTHAPTTREAHLPVKFHAENTPALPENRKGQSGKVLLCPQQDYPATSVAHFCTDVLTLNARFGDHANIGDIRGRGLFRGLEFVADRDTKEPLDPGLGLAGRLKKAAFAEGLICYPMPGTRDGRKGDHILLAPPFIATEKELDEMVERLSRAVDAVMAAV